MLKLSVKAAWLIVAAVLMTAPAGAQAAQPHPKTKSVAVPAKALQLYNIENAAIASHDYAKFIANGSARFKTGLTKSMFDGACEALTDRLRGGYTSTFVGTQLFKGDLIYAWTVTFKNRAKLRAIMALTTDHKVDGYLYRAVTLPPPPAAP